MPPRPVPISRTVLRWIGREQLEEAPDLALICIGLMESPPYSKRSAKFDRLVQPSSAWNRRTALVAPAISSTSAAALELPRPPAARAWRSPGAGHPRTTRACAPTQEPSTLTHAQWPCGTGSRSGLDRDPCRCCRSGSRAGAGRSPRGIRRPLGARSLPVTRSRRRSATPPVREAWVQVHELVLRRGVPVRVEAEEGDLGRSVIGQRLLHGALDEVNPLLRIADAEDSLTDLAGVRRTPGASRRSRGGRLPARLTASRPPRLARSFPRTCRRGTAPGR